MRLYTVDYNERVKGAFVIDCGSQSRSFFAAIYADLQAFYDNTISFEDLERMYFAELDARHRGDPAFVQQLLRQNLVLLTDRSVEIYVCRHQAPRYLAVAWLMARFRVPYQGDW